LQHQTEPSVTLPWETREGLLSGLSDFFCDEVHEDGSNFVVGRRVVARRVSGTELDITEYDTGGFFGIPRVKWVRRSISEFLPTWLHPVGEARLMDFLRSLHGDVFRTGDRFRGPDGRVVAELVDDDHVRVFGLRRVRQIRKLRDMRPQPVPARVLIPEVEQLRLQPLGKETKKCFSSRYLHLAPAWGLEAGNFDDGVIQKARWLLELGKLHEAYECIQFDRGAPASITIPSAQQQPAPHWSEPEASRPKVVDSGGQPLIWAALRFVWRGIPFSDVDKIAFMKETGMFSDDPDVSLRLTTRALRNVLLTAGEEDLTGGYIDEVPGEEDEDILEARNFARAKATSWRRRKRRLEDSGKSPDWKSTARKSGTPAGVQGVLDEVAQARAEAERQATIEAERKRFRAKFNLNEADSVIEKGLKYPPYVSLTYQAEVPFEGRTRRLRTHNFAFVPDKTPLDTFSEPDRRLATDIAAKAGGVIATNTHKGYRNLFVLVNGDTISIAGRRVDEDHPTPHGTALASQGPAESTEAPQPSR
jgi:hypothetical protein